MYYKNNGNERELSSHLIKKGDGALGRTLYINIKIFDQQQVGSVLY